ncbi:MAG: hypothetical protein ABIV43_01210, partial [Candidatus Saccharimonadales bacterium]
AKKSAEQISTSKVVEQHAKAQPLTVVKLPTTTIEKASAQPILEAEPVLVELKAIEISESTVVETTEKVEEVEPVAAIAGGGPDMGGGPEMQSSETQAAEHTPIVQGKPSVAPTVKSEFTIPALTHQRQILSPQSVAGQPERVMPNVSEAVTDILSDVPVAFETLETTASNPDQQLGDYLSTMLNEAIAETSVIYGLDSSEATDMVQLEPNPNTEAGSGRTEAGVAILNMLSIESSTSDMAEAATDKTPVQELHASLPTVIVELISQPAVDTTAEQLAATSELVETMALIAERLQDLIQTDRADGEEAQQIETVLEAYFDELCVLQGLPANPEERVCFIVRLKQSAHTKAQAAAIRQSAIDEGMRERKHGTHGQSHGIPITELTVYLARFVMGLRGLSLTP